MVSFPFKLYPLNYIHYNHQPIFHRAEAREYTGTPAGQFGMINLMARNNNYKYEQKSIECIIP